MSLGNGNPKEGDKGSNFDFERKSLKLLQAISDATSGGGGGSGTVTSVGLSMPAEFTVSSSPVTTSGTIGVTKATQTANTVYAAPNGSLGQPSFRSLAMNDLPQNSKLCTYALNGYRTSGLGARELLLLSPSSADDSFYYGAFNPASFNVTQKDAALIGILDIGAQFTGTVFFEVAMVLDSSITISSSVRPVLGVTGLLNGSTTRTYTNIAGTGVNPSSTTTESITYISGVITYTPSGSGDQIIFGFAEGGNVTLTNGHIHAFANLKFVLKD